MSLPFYRSERRHLDDGDWARVHWVRIASDQLKFEDLHPMNSYVRQQDIARMQYARAQARGEERPHILTWTAMQTDRRASQLFPNLSYATDEGEEFISANSFITYVLRKLLTEGWLQLHEYISDTYEWKVELPPPQSEWRSRADAIIRWLEEAIQLDLYPNIERGSYQPRLFSPFDAHRNFARIGRCDFVRHFIQNHDRKAVFNTSHFLHEHDDLISCHSGYGDAVGLMATANTILRPPVYRRGALLYDGDCWRIETLGLGDIRLLLPGDITLSNQDADAYAFEVNPADSRPIALYTRAGGLRQSGRPLNRTPLEAKRLEFVLVNRQIVSWKRGGGLQIPQNGFALSLQSGALPPGSSERILADAWVEYEFADDARAVVSGIQAGPILLRGGEDVWTNGDSDEEYCASQGETVGITPVHTDPASEDARKARTALAIMPKGDLLLALVDGCDPACHTAADSAGATLRELTAWLLEAGAVDALNLGGEGSSHLFVKGGLANTPSDRRGQAGVVYERMLPSIGIVG
ncbi:MAG: phosphodiester glycosidase family protein [Chloroflexi bacterium]|nr:phosphodiester glycosidase family protein [Chloroflexota bacterium]